ncbi:hypothetical protein RFI_22621, partial [Reticulomyxa filosa]
TTHPSNEYVSSGTIIDPKGDIGLMFDINGLHAYNVPLGMIEKCYVYALLECQKSLQSEYVLECMLREQSCNMDAYGLLAMAQIQIHNYSKARAYVSKCFECGEDSLYGFLAEVLLYLLGQSYDGTPNSHVADDCSNADGTSRHKDHCHPAHIGNASPIHNAFKHAEKRMQECFKYHANHPLAIAAYVALQFKKLQWNNSKTISRDVEKMILTAVSQQSYPPYTNPQQFFPPSVGLKYAAGLYFDYVNNNDQAASFYREALEPWSGAQWKQVPYPVNDALIRYALYLSRSGQFRDAQTYLEPVINSGHLSAEVYSYYGYVLMQLGQFEDAHKYLANPCTDQINSIWQLIWSWPPCIAFVDKPKKPCTSSKSWWCGDRMIPIF